MNRDRSLFRHFGLKPEALYWGSVHEKYARMLRDAVESRRMIEVVGGFGSGKSTLVTEALKEVPGLEQIYIDNSDRERLRIGNITQVMVASLTTENPRRDNTSRQIQLSRVMGETVVLKRKEIVVIIENAHRLHHSTLLALKDLRESVRYKGNAFLFSVVLVGQEPLRSTLERFGEVHYRTRPIELDRNGWMSESERVNYLDAIYGELIERNTRNRIAALFPTPLEMDHFIEEKLLLMRDAGVTLMDSTVVPFSIDEQKRLLKLSVRDIEKITKVPKSTVDDVLTGKNTDPETLARIQRGLDEYMAERGSHLQKVAL